MKASNSEVKEKYWLDHIRQAEQSGETFKRYAERHGLNLKSLYDWRSRLKNFMRLVAGISLLTSVT